MLLVEQKDKKQAVNAKLNYFIMQNDACFQTN